MAEETHVGLFRGKLDEYESDRNSAIGTLLGMKATADAAGSAALQYLKDFQDANPAIFDFDDLNNAALAINTLMTLGGMADNARSYVEKLPPLKKPFGPGTEKFQKQRAEEKKEAREKKKKAKEQKQFEAEREKKLGPLMDLKTASQHGSLTSGTLAGPADKGLTQLPDGTIIRIKKKPSTKGKPKKPSAQKKPAPKKGNKIHPHGQRKPVAR